MRISIDVTSTQHRALKTLAAFNSMSLKEFVLSRTLPEHADKAFEGGLDDTEYLLKSKANANALMEAMQRSSADSIKYNNLEDFLNANPL